MNDSNYQEGIVDSVTSLPHRRPIVTYSLLVVLVIITMIMGATGGSTSIENLLRFGAQTDNLVMQGEYWRLITAMFIHIGVVHLLCNGYALYVLGKDCERLFGRVWYIILFVLCGIVGNLLSLWTHHGTNIVSAGASGAIFGLAGAMAIVLLRKRVVLSQREGRELTRSIIPFIIYNIVFGLKETNIDLAAHIGGLMAGGVLAWILPFGKPLGKMAYACCVLVVFCVLGSGFAQLNYAKATTSSADEVNFFIKAINEMGEAGLAFQQNKQGLDVEIDHFITVVQKLKGEASQRVLQKDSQTALEVFLMGVLAQEEETLSQLKEAIVIVSVDDAKKMSKPQLEALAQKKSNEITRLYEQLGKNSTQLASWMQDVTKWAKTQGYDITFEPAADKPTP